jgi:hypothetical protein
MSDFFHYAGGYALFALGSVLYCLSKVQEYKDMAESNPDPKIVYNTKKFLNKEMINFIRLFLGGVALVILMPMLIGGTVVELKNSEGTVLTSVSLKTALMPLYFVTGLGGTSLLFSIFGRYRKTLLSRLPAEDGKG